MSRVPEPPHRPSIGPVQNHLKWGWWALGSGHVGTAQACLDPAPPGPLLGRLVEVPLLPDPRPLSPARPPPLRSARDPSRWRTSARVGPPTGSPTGSPVRRHMAESLRQGGIGPRSSPRRWCEERRGRRPRPGQDPGGYGRRSAGSSIALPYRSPPLPPGLGRSAAPSSRRVRATDRPSAGSSSSRWRSRRLVPPSAQQASDPGGGPAPRPLVRQRPAPGGGRRRRVPPPGPGRGAGDPAAACAITSPSLEILERTRAYYGLPLEGAEVIPPPTEMVPDRSRWAAESDPETIVFVGRFDRHKGGDLVIDAFAQVARGRPGARLRFVGPDAGIFVDDEGRPRTIAEHDPTPGSPTRSRAGSSGSGGSRTPPCPALRRSGRLTVVRLAVRELPADRRRGHGDGVPPGRAPGRRHPRDRRGRRQRAALPAGRRGRHGGETGWTPGGPGPRRAPSGGQARRAARPGEHGRHRRANGGGSSKWDQIE